MLFSNFFYRDIVPYLDEETQDALYYQDEDEPTFNNVPLLSSKLEKEISYMFPPSTLLIGLLQTMKKVASQLLDISDNEPYGVKGAKVILKLKYSNGSEESVGSFALDPNTVSYFRYYWTISFSIVQYMMLLTISQVIWQFRQDHAVSKLFCFNFNFLL